MRKLIIFLLLPVQLSFGQQSITLDSCYQWARKNYPNLKQTEVWKEISSLKKENLKTTYFPQLTLNGQASYQSVVTEIPAIIPNFQGPAVPKDQYKAYAEFRQTIWDGGISSINAQLEDAVLKTNLNQLEVEIYKLNDQVSMAFFTVLVVEKQLEVIEAQKKVLEEKLKAAESGMANGVVEPTSALVIKAELLNLEQNAIRLKAGKTASLQALSLLTGKNIDHGSRFVFDEPGNLPAELSRPELRLFASQAEMLGKQKELLRKTRNPRLFGFGQAGYGKPGMNMLNDNFDTWYMVGAGISWNAFDWKNTFRQKQILSLQQEMLQSNEQTFRQNMEVLRVQQNAQITQLKEILSTDEEMVSLRSDIAKASASKLENEVITTSDYIQDVQAETLAKLNYELHRIQLNEAVEKYRLLMGNPDTNRNE